MRLLLAKIAGGLAGIWVVLYLCSCSAPYHHAAVYKNGMLVKEETDFNPSIGGVHSQKGADGYQADDDNQQSLRDAGAAIGGAYAAHQGAITNASNNHLTAVQGHQGVQNTALTHPITNTSTVIGPKGNPITTSTTTVPALPK